MSRKSESPVKPTNSPTETPISNGATPQAVPSQPEFGGRKGPEATRFGDWELNGKCVDF